MKCLQSKRKGNAKSSYQKFTATSFLILASYLWLPPRCPIARTQSQCRVCQGRCDTSPQSAVWSQAVALLPVAVRRCSLLCLLGPRATWERADKGRGVTRICVGAANGKCAKLWRPTQYQAPPLENLWVSRQQNCSFWLIAIRVASYLSKWGGIVNKNFPWAMLSLWVSS